MRLTHLLGMLYLLLGMVFLHACENNIANDDFAESVELFADLDPVQQAANVNATITRGENLDVSSGNKVGADSWFQIRLENIGDNDIISNGTVGAWCLEWKKPLNADNTLHQGTKIFSTNGAAKWEPINYLFAIRSELKEQNPDLSPREFQAAIWTLAGQMELAPAFDLAKLSDEELPRRFYVDGQLRLQKDKVLEIVNRVNKEYKTNKSKISSFGGAFVMQTNDDEQNVVIPDPPATVITENDLGPSDRPAGFPDSHTVPPEDWYTPTHGTSPLNTAGATCGFVAEPNHTDTYGSGSFLFDVPAGERCWILTDQYGTGEWHGAPDAKQGTKLEDITTLSYSTYIMPGSAVLIPAMQIMAEDGSGNYLGLVFDPPSSEAQTGEWQTWDALRSDHAGWRLAWENGPSAYSTWDDLVTNKYPDATILWSVGVAAGTWPGQDFKGYTDLLTVGVNGNTDVYDFEP